MKCKIKGNKVNNGKDKLSLMFTGSHVMIVLDIRDNVSLSKTES
jgi:hypothetical protein